MASSAGLGVHNPHPKLNLKFRESNVRQFCMEGLYEPELEKN